jgi:leucyl-tRNA synthetase
MPIVPAADWYEKAAVAIVRNGKTLYQWVNENRMGGLTSRECENIGRTKEFQAALRAERNRFYKELSDDPDRSRNVAVGQLLYAIQKLLEAEQYDKAVSSLAQLFKVEGWTSDQAQISIFNDLNSKDLEGLKRSLEAKKKANK